MGVMSTILPILISRDTPRIIDAIANLDKYPLDIKYLHSLTKKQATAYIKGIHYAVGQGKIDKTKADLFLRNLFNNEYLLWMREEAIKTLIKLDMVSYEELDRLIETTADESVRKAIAYGLGEKASTDAMDFLIKWYSKESETESYIMETLIGTESEKALNYLMNLVDSNGIKIEQYALFGIGKLAYKFKIKGEERLTRQALAYLNMKLDRELYKREIDYQSINFIISALGESGDYEAVSRIVKFSNSHTYSRYYGPRGYRLVLMAHALSTAAFNSIKLGDRSTHDLALNRLKELMPERKVDQIDINTEFVLGGIANMGTLDAVNYLMDMFKFEFPLRNKRSDETISKLCELLPESVFKSKLLKDEKTVSLTVSFLIDFLKRELNKPQGKRNSDRIIELLKALGKTTSNLQDLNDKTHVKKIENYLIRLPRNIKERKYLLYALGQIKSEKALKHLEQWSKEEKYYEDELQSYIYGIMDKLHPSNSIDYIVDLIESKEAKLASMKVDNKNIKVLLEEDIDDKVSLLFSACGFRSIEIIRVSAKEKKKMPSHFIMHDFVRRKIDSELWTLNYLFDSDSPNAEKKMELYFKRLKKRPEILYSILAFSREITSHSFPLAYEYLKENIKAKYNERFDLFRYIQEEWNNAFLGEFLFTATIFDALEECLRYTQHKPDELAEIILSKDKIEGLLEKPSLFAKVMLNILSLDNKDLKNTFLDKIIDLAKEDMRFKIFIKLMLKEEFIPRQDHGKFTSVVEGIILPEYNSSWHAPQKKKLIDKDGAIVIDLFWSTDKGGEKAHYAEFPKIFTDGKNVNSFYKNFKGYIDRSDDPRYRDKLREKGAEKVLVKEFSQTGRKTEIYLYSSLAKARQSKAPMIISRSHSNENGNSDYPGLPGTLRFASHCRSINDSDSLIKVNPDSPIITITGTGRAIETNPTLYYMLEYLGIEATWGTWTDIKAYIANYIPKSIRKYNFPTDDISFIYSAVLEKMKQQKTIASNVELEIIGVSTWVESYITNPALQNL